MTDRLTKLSIGYGLDGGGYSFEDAPAAVGGAHTCYDAAGTATEVQGSVVMLDDPDWDYLPFERPQDYYGLDCPTVMFAPNSGHFKAHKFPESYSDGDGDTMVKIAEFRSTETDRACCCHGHLEEWTGAAGEPQEPTPAGKVLRWVNSGRAYVEEDSRDADKLCFKHTGNTDDMAYPDCDRCDGDGYVTSRGGEWALYAMRPDQGLDFE